MRFKTISALDERILDIEIELDTLPSDREALQHMRTNAAVMGNLTRLPYFDKQLTELDAEQQILQTELQDLRTRRPEILADIEKRKHAREFKRFVAETGGVQITTNDFRTVEQRQADIAKENAAKRERSLAQLESLSSLLEPRSY